jgi:hypothetical protein
MLSRVLILAGRIIVLLLLRGRKNRSKEETGYATCIAFSLRIDRSKKEEFQRRWK